MIYKQWSHFALQILNYSLRNNRENSQKKSYSTITINTRFKIPSIFIILNKPQPQVHCLQQLQCLHYLLCTFRAMHLLPPSTESQPHQPLNLIYVLISTTNKCLFDYLSPTSFPSYTLLTFKPSLSFNSLC